MTAIHGENNFPGFSTFLLRKEGKNVYLLPLYTNLDIELGNYSAAHFTGFPRYFEVRNPSRPPLNYKGRRIKIPPLKLRGG
jgi:hypothetical protein